MRLSLRVIWKYETNVFNYGKLPGWETDVPPSAYPGSLHRKNKSLTITNQDKSWINITIASGTHDSKFQRRVLVPTVGSLRNSSRPYSLKDVWHHHHQGFSIIACQCSTAYKKLWWQENCFSRKKWSKGLFKYHVTPFFRRFLIPSIMWQQFCKPLLIRSPSPFKILNNCKGASIKDVRTKLWKIDSPLVRTVSTPFPPCPCGYIINFKNPKFFAPKSADVCIWITLPCSKNIRTGQTPSFPPLSVDSYGRSLTSKFYSWYRNCYTKMSFAIFPYDASLVGRYTSSPPPFKASNDIWIDHNDDLIC